LPCRRTQATVPEVADAVVEVTDTGSTLRRHGLRIIDTLLESPTLLIANPAAYEDPAKRQAIEEIKILILGAINARGKVLMKLNVEKGHLAAVLEQLPSMRAPTVSTLADQTFYAVETVVEKKVVNVLIPKLKELGATDILELPLGKI